ncbi:MAG: hypothetical protein AAF800_10870 [Planctomycetota bacterium]
MQFGTKDSGSGAAAREPKRRDRHRGGGLTAARSAALIGACFAGTAAAQSVIESTFATSEGFTTGGTDPVTLTSGGLELTVSGGQQQQNFDGPSYNTGPDAYLFISGPSFTGSFGGTTPGTGDKGDLTFNQGVTSVSFFAADRGLGTPTVRVFGTDDTTVLAEVPVTDTNIRDFADPAPTPLVFDAKDLGGLIGRVQIDNAGPAGNPPYVTAIDTLSATRANRYDETVNGDLSDSGAAPTPVNLALGSNTVSGSVTTAGGDTRDYLTFTIGAGQTLASIDLLEYDDPDQPGTNDGNRGFYALVEGATSAQPGGGFDNLGGDHLDPEPFGTNLLDAIAAGGISGGDGFSEVGEGTYTFVVQQTGPQTSNYLLDFVVVPEPASLTLLAAAGALASRRGRGAARV